MSAGGSGQPRRTIPEKPYRWTRKKVADRLGVTPGGRRTLQLAGVRTAFCVGDSHSAIFDHVERWGFLKRTHFEVTKVDGATSRGLGNPNSKTNALERFKDAVTAVPADGTLLVMLGEVDCGFLIWYTSQHKGTKITEEFDRSISTHLAFLDELRAGGHERLVVVEVPIPTVEDYATWSGLGNARGRVRATWQERTQLTVDYNDELRAYAEQHSLRMLAYTDDVMDPQTGVIDLKFRHTDPIEHHLHPDRFSEVLAARLRQMGYR